MALTPKFEDQTSTTAAAADATADAGVAKQAQTAASEAAAASVTGTIAVAQAAASGSLTAKGISEAAERAKQFEREVATMRGASDFSYGNYDVFKGSNGAIIQSGGAEADLGRWAKVRLMSWDDHFEISPGENDGKTKEFVAYSKDGKVIDSVIGEDQRKFVGQPVDAYLTYLKETEGFDKAKMRRFIDTACALLGTDSGDGPVGKVIQVTLSESSIPAFSRYQQDLKDTARCVAMGLPGFSMPEDPFTFFFLREVASKGDNKWTKLKIVSTLPAKV